MDLTRKENRRRVLARQSERLTRRISRLEATNSRFVRLRLAVFAGGLFIAGIFYFRDGSDAFTFFALLTALVFALITRRHRRLIEVLQRHQLLQRFQRSQLARMALAWDDIPLPPDGALDADHPFAADLDLLGPRSLHHLLDTTVTDGGSNLLRRWLTTRVPDPTAIAHRQQLVRELVPQSLFRQRLTVAAMQAANDAGRCNTTWLLHWFQPSPRAGRMRWMLLLLTALAVATATLFVLEQLGRVGTVWPFTLVVYFALTALQWRHINPAFIEALALQDALRQLRSIFSELEKRSFSRQPGLAALTAPFHIKGRRPSDEVRRVSAVVSGTALRNNPLLWLLLNMLVPWDYFFAWRLAVVKGAIAAELPRWLDVWFEVEALNALANLAYLNPHYTFPDVHANAAGRPLFAARQLGHPLLPDALSVHNDLQMSTAGEVLLVTGSNMSGKSTFLRIVGVNTILAYCGAPVDAAALNIGLLRPFSSLRLADSLTAGISYFYAEVRRLRALLTALEADHPYPLLFFIDEIFRGTNNRERLQGSQAYVSAITGRYGIGIISTHDLELVHLAETTPQLRNVHFRDDFDDGQMIFDYRLRPGPCPTTNALKIMAAAGLPVPSANGAAPLPAPEIPHER